MKKAVIATGHPLVSRAAASIIEAGGNAFDAAAAAGFAGAVAEPALTSLAGGGFLLARTAGGRQVLFDFFTDTPGKGLAGSALEPHFFPVVIRFPGADQEFNVGLGSVAVPGNLKGFIHFQKRLGRLPLAAVLEPAIDYARNGIEINDHQSRFLSMLRPIMTLSQEGKDLFGSHGERCNRGSIFKNPGLADFLEGLKDEPEGFYTGETARRLVDMMDRGNGLLTLVDLEGYRVIERRPLETSYHGRRILTNPCPSFGGPLIAVALRLLDAIRFDDVTWGSPGHLTTWARIMMLVDGVRQGGACTPEDLDDRWFSRSASKIQRLFSRGTTHVSIADKEGNVASMTTSNGEGSGHFIPGTGIMLNNMMGEDDLHPEGFFSAKPGQRVSSMMSPSIMLHGDDVELVFGSGGSKRIRTAMIQVAMNVVDFDMPVTTAVRSPRMHWDGQVLQVEPGFPKEGLASLGSIASVNQWASIDVYFGGVQAVVPGKTGAGDPRRGGCCLVID